MNNTFKSKFALCAILFFASSCIAYPPSYERQVSLPMQTIEGAGGALAGLVMATGVLFTSESSIDQTPVTIISLYGFSYFLGMGVGLSSPYIQEKDHVSFPGMFMGMALGVGLDVLAYKIANSQMNNPPASPFVVMALLGPAFCGALGSRIPWWQTSSRSFTVAPFLPRHDAPGLLVSAQF